MAQTIKIELTDDLTGGEATETVNFSLDGRSYEIDLCEENAVHLREVLEVYVANARRISSARGTRQASSTEGRITLFSQLDEGEKERFRVWADLPTARRIADHKVQAWIDAGRL